MAFFEGYQFQLGSGQTCQHAALYPFRLFWVLQSSYLTSTSFSSGTNSLVTATYTSYTDTTAQACGSTVGTAYTYYIVTVTSSGTTATGRVSTAQGSDGLNSYPCGYMIKLVASSAVVVEYDTDGAILSGLWAMAAAVFALLYLA